MSNYPHGSVSRPVRELAKTRDPRGVIVEGRLKTINVTANRVFGAGRYTIRRLRPGEYLVKIRERAETGRGKPAHRPPPIVDLMNSRW